MKPPTAFIPQEVSPDLSHLVKIAPLMREISRHTTVLPILVHTGQDYDDGLSNVFSRQMDIPKPNVNLKVGSGSQASQTAEILQRIEPALLEQKPDLVLVVGDVNSTMAETLAAAKLCIQLCMWKLHSGVLTVRCLRKSTA